MVNRQFGPLGELFWLSEIFTDPPITMRGRGPKGETRTFFLSNFRKAFSKMETFYLSPVPLIGYNYLDASKIENVNFTIRFI